jgi:hypothetical protein
LYLVQKDTQSPLPLLPFFYIGTDEQHAPCYFYSRVERDEVRWISYHFEPQPVVLNEGQDTREIIETLALGHGD